MSRLADIFGVKDGQEFKFRDTSSIYKIFNETLYERNVAMNNNVWFRHNSNFGLIDMINHSEFIKPIPEKIELDETQKLILRGRFAEGFEWIAKDFNEDFYAYEVYPLKEECLGIFNNDTGTKCSNIYYDFPQITFENSPLNIKDLLGE